MLNPILFPPHRAKENLLIVAARVMSDHDKLVLGHVIELNGYSARRDALAMMSESGLAIVLCLWACWKTIDARRGPVFTEN